MIKRLRIKLIIASMASLFAVLVTIMAVMAAVNYDKITDVADSTLSILMENDGMFPQMEQGFDEKPDRQPPEMDKPKEDDPGMSPELPYESRYFTVVIDEDGEAVFRKHREDSGGRHAGCHRICPAGVGLRRQLGI